MKHLNKILKSLIVLSATLLAVSCTSSNPIANNTIPQRIAVTVANNDSCYIHITFAYIHGDMFCSRMHRFETDFSDTLFLDCVTGDDVKIWGDYYDKKELIKRRLEYKGIITDTTTNIVLEVTQ